MRLTAPMTAEATEYHTVDEISQRYRIDRNAVHRLIASGELVATNVSSGKQRPRWRIAESDLQDFLQRRKTQALAGRAALLAVAEAVDAADDERIAEAREALLSEGYAVEFVQTADGRRFIMVHDEHSGDSATVQVRGAKK